MHTFPVLPTANTKGTKRSRTRTDSYTAGQSVGQFPTQAETITMFHFLFNKGKIVFLISDYVASSTEALEGIDLGETTHKKAGTTVPESIHSFSELPAYSDLSDFILLYYSFLGLLCLFCHQNTEHSLS